MMTLPTPEMDWAAAYAEYRRLLLLRDADAAFGVLAEARYNHEMAVQQAQGRSGSAKEALIQRDVKAASRALSAAEERHHAVYGDPLEAAAMAAVLAPAPDLSAVEIKVKLIQQFELDNCVAMPRQPMEIVEEDLAGLAVHPNGNTADRPIIATDQATAHLINADRLAETIGDLIGPDSNAPDLWRAVTLLDLQQDELRRAAEALGEQL